MECLPLMYVGAMEMPHHIPTLLEAMSFVAFVNVLFTNIIFNLPL